uniref:Cytochrome P450 monooxygenase CYP4CG17 n=1 Tax=Cnaphalocrocis medinalis TaxID=437488 RepID=A0A0C5BXG0_CNAME|nr:cytochrome P450 monooxygenase CYP4CG17 [Cnaphalocrocis medinalis]
MIYLVACGLLVMLFMVPAYFRFSRAGRLLRKIPGSNGSFFYGNTFDVTLSPEKIFQYIRELYKKYGCITKLSGFHIRTINIYEPDDIEKVLSTTRFNEKQRPYDFLKPWLNEGLLTSNGMKWHQRRKLLTPAFHFDIRRKFLLTINEQTEQLLKTIQEEVGKEKTNVLPIMTKSTLRVMCDTSMGISNQYNTSSLAEKYFKAMHIFGSTVVHRMTRVWFYADWFFHLSPTWRTQRATIKDLHRFTNEIIRERKVAQREKSIGVDEVTDDDNGKKRGRLALLDLLLEQEAAGMIDEQGVREEVDTFMFEGHDTTAMALSFMIMAIANEPEVQDKIYEEMKSIFGSSDRSPTMDDLVEMKYLECCIKESLRLYPSVPFIARYLTEEVTLSGYRIPAHTICHIHVLDVHRRADLYPEPERFVPERFGAESAFRRHPYAYIPFSAGPRNCIGQKFAMMEMKSVLSGLVRRFRVEPVTRPGDLRYTADIVLRVTHPLYVRFKPRTDL